MSTKELLRRYSVFTAGIFIIALGISVIVRSKLGTPPISSSPYVFAENTPLSIGSYLFILCLFLIGLQVIMLGWEETKNKKLELLAQIPISFLFGLFTDLCMFLLSGFNPSVYPVQIIALVVGCVILAVGISLEVSANVAMMSAEYTVQIAAKKLNKEFGTVKVGADLALIALAVVSSLLFTQTVIGVREGTIIAALITGPIVRIFMPRLAFLREWLSSEQHVLEAELATGVQPLIITISREYGSGGHEIGEMLARRLGIAFYDKKLIGMVAREGNFSETFVRSNEQRVHTSLLYQMIMQDYEAPLERSLSAEDALFVAQSKVIKRIASEGACVIVGRCADYVLGKYKNSINVFLHADMEDKTERTTSRYGIEAHLAAAHIEKTDKARMEHYYHYTGKRWGDARNYDLTINTSKLSTEEICTLIIKMTESGVMVNASNG